MKSQEEHKGDVLKASSLCKLRCGTIEDLGITQCAEDREPSGCTSVGSQLAQRTKSGIVLLCLRCLSLTDIRDQETLASQQTEY